MYNTSNKSSSEYLENKQLKIKFGRAGFRAGFTFRRAGFQYSSFFSVFLLIKNNKQLFAEK